MPRLTKSLAVIHYPTQYEDDEYYIELLPMFESWLLENSIQYKTELVKGDRNRPWRPPYHGNIKFENFEDEVAFKLRWL